MDTSVDASVQKYRMHSYKKKKKRRKRERKKQYQQRQKPFVDI